MLDSVAAAPAGQVDPRMGRAGIPARKSRPVHCDKSFQDAAAMLRCEIVGDGILTFDLMSYGELHWYEYLRRAGCHIDSEMSRLLEHAKKAPLTVTKAAIILGSCFDDDGRSYHEICTRASELGMVELDLEEICLLRVKFTVQDIEQLELEDLRCISSSVCGPRSVVVIGREVKRAGSITMAKIDDGRVDLPARVGYAFAISRRQESQISQ